MIGRSNADVIVIVVLRPLPGTPMADFRLWNRKR
jgi:uncharacterized radical SAM superfamily protein